MTLAIPQLRLDKYLKLNEAAEFLGVSTWTLRNWDKTGKLKSLRHPINGYRMYQKAELEAILHSESLRPSEDEGVSSQADWSHMGTSEHFVQFYKSDKSLASSVSAFIGQALKKGEAGVIIGTKAHRDAIEKHLRAQGINVTDAATCGQLISLDAAETLSRFMAGQMPDPARFNEVIGETVARLAKKYRGMRLFGEMVALLWEDGNQAAAICLEELWNELSKVHRFSLFCAYPIGSFANSSQDKAFDSVCGCHSRVIPMEKYSYLHIKDKQLRAIAKLEQKATALEAEVIHRKEVEKELLKRETELRDFFENAAEGIHAVGADGTILWANKAELNMLGYRADEYIGRKIDGFHVDQETIRDIFARLERGETLKDYEARMFTKTGAIKHVLINSNAFWNEREFLYTRCFTRDITQRKEAEAALRNSQIQFHEYSTRQIEGLMCLNGLAAKLATIYEPQFMLEAILEAITSLHHTNRGLLSLYDTETGALKVGASLGFNEEFKKCLHRVEPGIGACGTAYKEKRRVIVEDIESDPLFDSLRDLARKYGFRAVHSTPVIAHNGECIGVLSVHFMEPRRPTDLEIQLTDICVRMAADFMERLKVEEALKEADRRKDEFLATLAHELRNPLAPINNALHILQAPKASETVKEEARKMMERQAYQMGRLIDDLMDVSRVSRGKIQLQKKPLLVNDVLQAAIETAKPVLTERKHELIISQPHEVIWLDGDAVILSQIFANLLNNAAKYTDVGGHINLAVRRDGSEVVISVKDDGIGIPQKMLSSIFDMFVQVDGALERARGGLGIGLTLVKELIKLHGGRISVASEGMGKGSEFVGTLPCIEKQQDATQKERDTKNGPAHRVLVVDDNEPSAKTLAWALEFMGHEVMLAHTAQNAIDTAKATHPAVILLDIGLPGTNGYDVCKLLKQDPGLKDTIIIAQTGWGQPEHRQRSKEAGFNHHLVKPIDMEILRKLLGSLPSDGNAFSEK